MLLYGPYSVSVGKTTTITGLGGYPDTVGMVVMNESPYLINVFFNGVGSWGVPAQTNDVTSLSNQFSGTVSITPVDYLNTSDKAPSYVVFIQTLTKNDTLYKALMSGGATGYPVASSRLQSVGNDVNTNVTTTTTSNIQNDNTTAGTQIIEAKPTGVTNSQVVLDNLGNLTLGDTTSYGATLTINGATHAASFFAANTEIFGSFILHTNNIQLDNNQSIQAKDNGGVLRTILRAANTNKTIIQSLGDTVDIRDQNNGLLYQFGNGNSTILFNSTGFTLQTSGGFAPVLSSGVNTYINGSNSSNMQVNGITIAGALATGFSLFQKLNLSGAGSITAMSIFTGNTVSNGTVSVNHNLGTTPDDCIVTIKSASGSSTHSETWNSTQCTVFNAAGILPFVGIAYKA